MYYESGSFEEQKKERRLAPPLRVEVSELRLRKTADPPRPFQLRPFSGISAAGSRSAGLLRPPYLSTSSDPRLRWLAPAPPLASGLAPFRPRVRSGSRLPFPGTLPRRSASRSPILLQPKLFPIARLSAAFAASSPWACRGFRLLASISRDRVSLSSRLVGTAGCLQSPAWATCSVPREHSVPLSSTLLNAFRRVGRPAGGFCLTGRSGYPWKFVSVKRVFSWFMTRSSL